MTKIVFLTIPETGSLKPRWSAALAPFKSCEGALVPRIPPTSTASWISWLTKHFLLSCLHIIFTLHTSVCVQIFPLYKDTNLMGLGFTLKTSSQPNHLQRLFPKKVTFADTRVLESHYLFEGHISTHNSVKIIWVHFKMKGSWGTEKIINLILYWTEIRSAWFWCPAFNIISCHGGKRVRGKVRL